MARSLDDQQRSWQALRDNFNKGQAERQAHAAPDPFAGALDHLADLAFDEEPAPPPAPPPCCVPTRAPAPGIREARTCVDDCVGRASDAPTIAFTSLHSDDEREDFISRALSNEPTQLKLSGIRLGDSGLAQLSKALPSFGHGASIKVLRLDGNEAGDKGVSCLAAACELGALTSLESFFAANNRIGGQGAAALSATLSAGALADLGLLDLNGNGIGDDGIAALGQRKRMVHTSYLAHPLHAHKAHHHIIT